MDRFYEGASSIFVDAYDAFYDKPPERIAGDIAFYADLARATGGSALEVACGTGRITIPMAKDGVDITGVDRSEAMLSIAKQKASLLPPAAQKRLHFVHQDMTKLKLDRQFGLIFVPFRSFQHLLTVDLQIKALEAFRNHLAPDGKLVLHLFDPRLELLVADGPPIPPMEGVGSRTGHRFVGEVLRTDLDHVEQIRRDLWRYSEYAPDGATVRADTREMTLRWTYRWELRHLLSLVGFEVEAEYSDLEGNPPAYGKEMVTVSRKR